MWRPVHMLLVLCHECFSSLRGFASPHLLSLLPLWFFLGQFGLHVLHMTTAGPSTEGRCILKPSERTAAELQRLPTTFKMSTHVFSRRCVRALVCVCVCVLVFLEVLLVFYIIALLLWFQGCTVARCVCVLAEK